jgi:hypothetical protein
MDDKESGPNHSPFFKKKDFKMMMMGGNKKMIDSIIVGMKRPGIERKEKGYSTEEVSNKEPEEDFSDYDAFADEILTAIKDGSKERLASILRAFGSKFKPNNSIEEME